MAAEPSFSRITVTPDEEDVVIQAGIRSDAHASSEGASFEDAGASADEGSAAGAHAAKPSGSARAAAPSGAAAGAAASRPASEGDNYRATTLEDIESSKMSVMQKAIIAVAVIAIVAFAVWYVLAG